MPRAQAAREHIFAGWSQRGVHPDRLGGPPGHDQQQRPSKRSSLSTAEATRISARTSAWCDGSPLGRSFHPWRQQQTEVTRALADTCAERSLQRWVDRAEWAAALRVATHRECVTGCGRPALRWREDSDAVAQWAEAHPGCWTRCSAHRPRRSLRPLRTGRRGASRWLASNARSADETLRLPRASPRRGDSWTSLLISGPWLYVGGGLVALFCMASDDRVGEA